MPIPIAVLIDGENVSNKLFEPLKPLVEAIGIVSSWQLFGDFYTWPHPGWHEVANANGIEIRHQFNGGKNAADIAMTIAAMELMHAGKVRAVCLVSSDSDFTALARRLRADAMQVYGFGEEKAPEPYRKACTSFQLLIPPLGIAEPGAEDQRVLDQAGKRVLLDLLHSVCREKGTDGRILASVAAKYVLDKAPGLHACVSPHFVQKLTALGFVDVHGSGSGSLLSIRRKPLVVVG